MEFNHKKEFVTPAGKLITMKSLVTMHGVQYVDSYETDTRYPAESLQEVKN